MSKFVDRYDEMWADREAGMTYDQIGKKHGVSRQRVYQICGHRNRLNFRVVKEDGCVYKNLREWMNANSVTRFELAERSGADPRYMNSASMNRFRQAMLGRVDFPEEVVSAMVKITGMSREKLFELG